MSMEVFYSECVKTNFILFSFVHFRFILFTFYYLIFSAQSSAAAAAAHSAHSEESKALGKGRTNKEQAFNLKSELAKN